MQAADRTAVSGPFDAVEITTDEWGIPHVVASNARDAFFGQGYAQAQLRLFQMDLWRRRGLGILSEVLGADYVELDVAARTFLPRNDVETEFDAYPARSRDRIEAFAEGVNAWVSEVRVDPALLPPEFSLLGYAPSLWSASDLLRIRIHGLSSNAEEEVARSRTLAAYGPEIEKLRRLLETPVGVELPLLDGPQNDLELDDRVLTVYRDAHLPVPFGIAPTATAPLPPDGSNNWAVAGSRTRSGRPILASDPHRIMTLPSLRVLVHVTCPEFDFIGMQEPYLPGVVAGHNAFVAFGITIAPADLEDLYVYQLHPTDDALYRYEGGWAPIETVTEYIRVAGGSVEKRELRFTQHGPILDVNRDARTAVALRAAWLEPGMAPYLAGIDLVDAANAAEYVRRLDGWGNPVLNHVVADVGGHIAWQVAGRVPRRPNWNGLLPVSGDGSHEWHGMRTAGELPGLADPANGWVRSANQQNLDEDPDFDGDPFSYEWYSGFRARRLATVLDASDDWTIEQTAALQNDYLVEPARELLAHFAHPFANAEAEFARREILDWDQRMTADSRPALVFDRWLYTELPRAIRREAARRFAPQGLADDAAEVLLDERLLTLGDARVDMLLLERSADWSPSDTFESTAELVAHTLASTVHSLRSQLGTDIRAWRWGAAHVSRLAHPLHGLGVDASLTDTGSHPKPESADTIGVSFGAGGVQTLGAATRVVIDVGEWDNSLCINSPGQDGAPGAAHSLDQYATWLADSYVPLLYSRDRIDQHAESRCRLLPRSLHTRPATAETDSPLERMTP